MRRFTGFLVVLCLYACGQEQMVHIEVRGADEATTAHLSAVVVPDSAVISATAGVCATYFDLMAGRDTVISKQFEEYLDAVMESIELQCGLDWLDGRRCRYGNVTRMQVLFLPHVQDSLGKLEQHLTRRYDQWRNRMMADTLTALDSLPHRLGRDGWVTMARPDSSHTAFVTSTDPQSPRVALVALESADTVVVPFDDDAFAFGRRACVAHWIRTKSGSEYPWAH